MNNKFSYTKHIMWTTRKDDAGQKIKLYGELYLPSGAEMSAFTHIPYPMVLTAHPFGSSHTYMTPYAERLAERGFVVYNFDFFGGGEDVKSDGTLAQMSVQTEVDDLTAVLMSLRDEPFCDQGDVCLMGASQGGLVASEVAKQNPDLVKAITLLFPAYVVHDDAARRFSSADEVPQSYVQVGHTVGRRYGVDALALDPYRDMGAFKGDVLIMHGDADELVPLSYSQRAAKAFPNARLEVFPGAGHGFHGDDFEKASSLAGDFMYNQLRK